MRTIWKYLLDVADEWQVDMPAGARILPHVQALNPGTLAVWAEVDTGAPLTTTVLRVFGTGNPVNTDGCEYVGTAVAPPFVWHVYQEKP